MSTEVSNTVDIPVTTSEVEASGTDKKHLLRDKWDLWVLCYPKDPPKDAKKKGKSMNDTKIYAIPTVEDFWSIHNNIKTPSELVLDRDKTNIIYSLFDVEPKWEDPAHHDGGIWSFTMETELPSKDAPPARISDPKPAESPFDKAWLDTLLSLIGGTLETHDALTGIWLKIRFRNIGGKPKPGVPVTEINLNTIEIWHKNVEDGVVIKIGQEWVSVLEKAGIATADIKLTHEYIRVVDSADGKSTQTLQSSAFCYENGQYVVVPKATEDGAKN